MLQLFRMVALATGTPLLAWCIPSPVTVAFFQGTNGYTGAVDRVVGGAGGAPISSVALPADFLLRYAGSGKYHYLIRFDVSTIPRQAIIQSATLTLTSGAVTAAGAVHIQALSDPAQLGAAYASGWSTVGAANVELYRSGATAAFRDQSVSPAIPWTTTATSPLAANVLAAALAEEAPAPVWNASQKPYAYSVTQAVSRWVSGAAPNQGWLVYGDDTVNIQRNHSLQDANAGLRPTLTVTFLPVSQTATFQQGVNAYSGTVDRQVGGPGGAATGATSAPSDVLLRYSGNARYNYLLRYDLSAIPTGATIESATLTLKSGTVFVAANVHARRLVDPGGLGTAYSLGWSNAGSAGTTVFHTGATAAYRDESVSPPVKWSSTDPSDNNTHIGSAAAADEGAVNWTASETYYSFSVAAAVRAWVNGAPNQGWLIYADDTANLSRAHSAQDGLFANRPKLTVVYYQTSASPPGDSTPPATITGLRVASCGQTSCALSWTAPGDNGNSGTAAAYEVRYATSGIAANNWALATSATGAPAPALAGTLQSMTVSGLTPGVTYFFAIETRDAAGNVSSLSNSPGGTTLPANLQTAVLQQGVSSYSGVADRVAGGPSGGAAGAIPAPASTLFRYAGNARFNYLLRFDLSSIPAGSTIVSATLTLKSGWSYVGGYVHAQRLTDAGGLGAALPLGWSNTGTPNTTVFHTGATAVYRNESVSPAVKWSPGDAPDGNSHIQAAGAPEETPVLWTLNETFYDLPVTQAVQAWSNGAPNQGWLIYGDDSANLQNVHTAQDAVASNRPKLTILYVPPADLTPPAPVSTLVVTSCLPLSCALSWTAPGDNGNVGTAAAYDLRFSTSPITSANWNQATPATLAGAPLPAGSAETATIRGLTAATTYYFAIKSQDAAGNVSGLSNVASSATGPATIDGIVTYHPRIVLNRDLNLAAIRSRATGSLASDYTSLLNAVDLNANLGAQAENDLITMVYGLCYMYQITSDVRYADKVIDGYLFGFNWSTAVTGDATPAFQLEAAAIAFDWLYDRIAARGLTAAAVAKLKTAYGVVSDDAAFQNNIREADFHNYTTEFEAAMLMTGLALTGEDAAASAMVQKGWGMIATGYSFSPTTFGDVFAYRLKASIDLTDGAMNWEGPVYWRNAVPQIVRAIEAYDTATNRQFNVWATLFSNTVNAGYYKLYTLRPDRTTPGLGDSDAGGVMSWKDNLALVVLMNRFADGYLRALIDQVSSGWAGASRVFKLLFYDPAITARPFTDLPLSRQFGRDIVMRSGWGTADAFLTFSAGYSGISHGHLDDNSFTIFRGADLATSGGYSLSSGYYNNYFRRTVAHNAITVFDAAECWHDSDPASCDLSNDGGQRWSFRRFNPPFQTHVNGINRLWSGTLTSDPTYREMFLTASKSLDSGAGYDYVVSDATKAYSNQWSGSGQNTNRRVTQAVRELLYLRPDYVLVLDRVSSTSAGFTKSWLLHSVNPPQVLQNSAWTTAAAGISDYTASDWKVDNGTGRLFGKTLLPSSSTVRAIGGSGFDAWVNGTNYGISGLPATAGKWRLEVKPGAPATDDLFFHVLYPTTTATSGMPPVSLIDTGAMIGALITDPTAPVVALFTRGGGQSSVSYTAALSGTAHHVITGLVAGTYAVQQNGVAIGAFAASTAGAVAFQATGGGSFQLTRQ